MESVIYVFNTITNFLKEIINGIVEFFNTIPYIFNSISGLLVQIFPSDFASYVLALIPILIILVVIRFIRG